MKSDRNKQKVNTQISLKYLLASYKQRENISIFLQLFHFLSHVLLSFFLALNLKDFCLQRLAVDCNPVQIVSRRMLFPVAKVPAQFCLSCYVHSPLVKLSHDLPKIIDSNCLCHPIAEVSVCSKSRKEDFEQVSPHAGIVSAWILFSQLQVLKGETVEVHNLPAEKSWILQQRLSAHNSVYIRLGQAFVDIIEEIDTSVGNDRNVESFLNLFDDCPIAFSYFVLVLLLGPAMNSKQLAACLLDSLCQLYSLLFGLHSSDFAEDRNFDVLSQSSDNPLDQLWLFQQKRTIMPFPCDALRASQVDINRIDLIFQHLGCPHHNLRIVPANLSNNWSILRTGGEVYTLVSLCGGHHLGMQHGCICQIDSVFSSEHAEGKLGLVDHRPADQSWVLEKRQMVVVVLHVKEILLLGIQIRMQASLFGVEIRGEILGRSLNDCLWIVGKVELILLKNVRHFCDFEVDVFA